MDWLVFYILVWPVISAGVLAVLLVALVRDFRGAKRDGHEMI